MLTLFLYLVMPLLLLLWFSLFVAFIREYKAIPKIGFHLSYVVQALRTLLL